MLGYGGTSAMLLAARRYKVERLFGELKTRVNLRRYCVYAAVTDLRGEVILHSF